MEEQKQKTQFYIFQPRGVKWVLDDLNFSMIEAIKKGSKEEISLIAARRHEIEEFLKEKCVLVKSESLNEKIMEYTKAINP